MLVLPVPGGPANKIAALGFEVKPRCQFVVLERDNEVGFETGDDILCAIKIIQRHGPHVVQVHVACQFLRA